MASATGEKRLVLLNLAHDGRSPQRCEGAAVRILGIFPDEHALRRHAETYYCKTGVDVIAVPLRKWVAVLRVTQGGDELGHLDQLGAAYKDKEQRHEEEFRSNVVEQRTGAVERAGKRSSPPEPSEETAQRVEAPVVPRAAELRLQRYAVISVLPDVAEPDITKQQPALLVWEAFDSENDARACIKDELAMKARDVHLNTVTMYEWIPLTGVDSSRLVEEFRDETLSNIIQARKGEATQVENYRSLCAQRGQGVNLLDLGAEPRENDVAQSVPPPLEHQEALRNLLEPAGEEAGG